MTQLRLVSVETIPEQPALPPEMLLLTDRLHDAGQYDLAHAVLDRYLAYQHVLEVAQQCLAGSEAPEAS